MVTFRNPLPITAKLKLSGITLIYKAVVMVWITTGQTELLIGWLSQLQTRGVYNLSLGLHWLKDKR